MEKGKYLIIRSNLFNEIGGINGLQVFFKEFMNNMIEDFANPLVVPKNSDYTIFIRDITNVFNDILTDNFDIKFV